MDILKLTEKRFRAILNYSINDRFSLYKKYYYSPVLIYDANTKTSNQEILYKGNIYQIKLDNYTPESIDYSLNNCIIIALTDIKTTEIDFSKCTINNNFYYDHKEYIDCFDVSLNGDEVITNKFIVIIHRDDLEKAVYNPDFNIDETYKNGEVKIPDNVYKTILTAVGYPLVEDNQLELNKTQIMEFVVKETLNKYFSYFPKLKTISQPINNISSPMLIDYPENCMGIIHIGIRQSYTNGIGGNYTPWVNYYNLGYRNNSSLSSVYYRNLGGIGNVNYTGRMASQASMNRLYQVNYQVIYIQENGIDKKKLQVITNKPGTLEILFSVNDFNFNDVDGSEIQNIIKYASAKLKYTLGSYRRLGIRTDNTFDYQTWMAEGKEEMEKLENYWANNTTLPIIRSC